MNCPFRRPKQKETRLRVETWSQLEARGGGAAKRLAQSERMGLVRLLERSRRARRVRRDLCARGRALCYRSGACRLTAQPARL